MPSRNFWSSLFSVTLMAVLSACGWHAQHDVTVLVIGDKEAPFATAAPLPPAGALVHAATTQGLVGLDDQGRISPALADRWIVTDDGQSYIFRLRDGDWPDGAAISGDSVRVALHQAIAGVAHTPLALDLDGIVDLRAMAGRVLEIRLSRPMPDFLQLLAQPELGLSHGGRGTGPMTLKRKDGMAMLTAIAPGVDGLAGPAGAGGHRLELRATAGSEAVSAFAQGRADIVLGGTFVDVPRIGRTALGASRGRFDPVSGLFGLAVMRSALAPGGLLADAARREAVAMAIDRDTLAAAIAQPTLVTTTRMVAPGMIGDTGQIDERWAEVSLADRRAQAGGRIGAWMQQSHQVATLRMAFPLGPGADLLFARLAQDLAAVGLTVVRVADGAPADLRLIDVVARYARAAWFLDQLSCMSRQYACSAAADAIAARARAAGDPAVAADLYAQAEATLTQENTYIPLGEPIRWSLVAGNGAGFAVNRWGLHALIALAVDDH